MIFIYDKQSDLTGVVDFNKKKLRLLYIAENNILTSLDVYKEKNIAKNRKVVVEFDRDIKLWFNQIEDYDYILRATAKNSNRIEFPRQISRVQMDINSTPGLYTIKSDLLNDWMNKV